MAFTIITKNKEKTFTDKELVNICSKEGYDFQLDTGFDFMLAIQYDAKTNKCILLNQFDCKKFLFKGKAIPAKLEIEKLCKIMVEDSDEYITIKIIGSTGCTTLADENLTEQDLKELYGNDINASARLKIEKRKAEIEDARISIIKEVSFEINDLKHKLSMNSKNGIILHIGLFLASIICSFGLSNYIMGLELKDAGNIIQMPTNMKIVLIFALIIYSIGLALKQGIFLYLQNKSGEDTTTSRIAEKFLLIIPFIFYISIYLINTLYFMSANSMPLFAVFISLFFIGTTATIAIACGYFKHNNVEISQKLDKYEYREDFEKVVKEYQQWIERYANNLSQTKIRNIKDKIFTLQIKSVFETFIGICTAPILAYGVSNTLAMCFPEAAGWIRISSLRLSPVFLGLATFLIIFAFFAFTNAFLSNKKIQSSNVLKQDGFSNYLQHGVEIYGLAGILKLNTDMRRSFIIGLSIIFIEFSMNVSYFMQVIGGDLGGMLLSMIAALVPTALLIAETYMLSQTKFETFACDELLTKIDKD